MPEDQTPLTLQQAVKRSGKSEKTLRRWIASGRLVAHKAGGKAADPYLIKPTDLDAATGNETTGEWQLEKQVSSLGTRLLMLESEVEELRDLVESQALIIEELKRQRSAPPPAKKKTTTTRRKTGTTRVTRRKPLDDFG